MSRMTPLGAALALTASMAMGAPSVQAQQTEEQLVARIDSLLPLFDAARQEADAAMARQAEALRQANPATLDTTQVGPLTIVSFPHQADEAAEMYGRIWEDEYAPFVNHSAALDSTHFTFQWAVRPEAILMEGHHYRSEQRAWRGKAHLEGLIRASITRAISVDLQRTEILAWVHDIVRKPDNYGWVYRTLATTPATVSRACLDGEAGACWSALAIDPDPEEFLEWYSPEERRALVQTSYRGWRREEQPMFYACLDEGILEQCDAILTRNSESPYYDRRWFAPLGDDARVTMLWFAVHMGGEGAWDRLVEDPGMSVAEALRYASGATTDELEAAWRAEVLAHRPDAHAGLDTTKWTALFWILLCGALAMRSTRWRLA